MVLLSLSGLQSFLDEGELCFFLSFYGIVKAARKLFTTKQESKIRPLVYCVSSTKISSRTLKDKIHIHARACNRDILYVTMLFVLVIVIGPSGVQFRE